MKTKYFEIMPILLFGILTMPTLSAEEKTPEKEKYLLRYTFHENLELRWNVRQKVTMTTSIQGNVDIVESTSRSTKLWKLIDLTKDGTATFEYQVENVAMRQSRIVGERAKIDEYDSRKDENIPGAFITLEGTIGVPLARITVDRLGKTTKKPLREYRDSENTENRIVVLLPEHPVAAGEYWDDFQNIDIQKPDGTVKKIKLRRRYTLESVQTGLARIKYDTQVQTVLTPREQYGIIDKYVKGSIEIDLDAGHFIRQKIEVDKSIVGFQGANDSVHQLTHLTECSCGLKSCEVCNEEEKRSKEIKE